MVVMPLYDFRCPCGHVHEEVFPHLGAPPSIPCPACGATSVRSSVYLVTVVGTVFDGGAKGSLYDQSVAMLGGSAVAAGREFKSQRELDRYVASQGLRPMDADEQAQSLECTLDEVSDRNNRARTGGAPAVMAYAEETELAETVGMDHAEYTEFRAGHDAALAAVEDGTITPGAGADGEVAG